MSDTFKAYLAEKQGETVTGTYQDVPISKLPDNDVNIRVRYSSLNYKDALSARGRNNVTRTYPHIPGIDAAGEVISDRTGTFREGDSVIVTGYDLGTNTFGGYGSVIAVPADWVVPMPKELDPLKAMIVGTAGFTAFYGIKRLQREQIQPDSGKILVTGASGGVGSFAVFGLAALGYEVVAGSREPDVDFLSALGATEWITTDELMSAGDAPLLKRRWAGSVDTVGGELLDAVLRQTEAKGAVACCGNILGMRLESSILPFILRGISLLGIDSAFCRYPLRREIWDLIAEMDLGLLPDGFYRIAEPDEWNGEIDRILEGDQKGRVVFRHPE